MIKFNLLKKSSGKVEKFLKETTYKLCNEGWGSGYVFLSPEHPFHGKDFNILNHFIYVHGDLTFSEIIGYDMCQTWGIDNKYVGWWCVGFYTSHFGDTITDWPKEEVEKETEYLAQQFLKFRT